MTKVSPPNCLPTGVFGSWTVAAFRDSLIFELQQDTHYHTERQQFEIQRAKALSTTFTWSKKTKPDSAIGLDI